ncbi:MAG: hypothetical protein ACXWK8_07355 [Myxococcaceae bacterium]
MSPPGRATLPSRSGVALLIACVLPVLWFGTVRPALTEARWPWPGHPAPFTLTSYLPGDCPFYRATIVSLLEDADLDLRNNVNWAVLSPETQVAIARTGAWVPKHPLGLSLAALPFYALLGDAGLLGFNLLQLLALDCLLLLAARQVASETVAFGVALLFALGTLLRPVALNFSPDVFSTLLVMGGALALLSSRPALGGALLGAAVGAKWTNLSFVPLGLALCWASLGRRASVRFLVAAAPFLLALGLLNAHLFGSPFVTPYDRVGVHLLYAPAVEASHRSRFTVPFWSGLATQLLDPEQGLLRTAPPLLLSLAGIPLLVRRFRREALLVVSFSLAQLATFASYVDWRASSIGHRFLMTVVALGVIPAALLCERAFRGITDHGGEHA